MGVLKDERRRRIEIENNAKAFFYSFSFSLWGKKEE
jgi:hypothetical protein